MTEASARNGQFTLGHLSRKAFLGALMILLSPAVLSAGPCAQLSSSILRTMTEAISLRFDLAPDLTLEDQGTVNETCYRRLFVRSREPKRSFFLYLSPDQRFVTPDLLDLTLGQLGERLRENAETQKLLLSEPSPTRGPEKSAVTLVEFADFQCPYCKQFSEYLSRARSQGLQFRLVFKQTPLPQHAWAHQAAVLSSCAGQQSDEAFWQIHDFLFEHQASVSASTLNDKVRSALSVIGNIDLSKFDKCATETKESLMLQADERLAEEFHVKETPTVFINGSRKVGLMSLDDLIAAIRSAKQ